VLLIVAIGAEAKAGALKKIHLRNLAHSKKRAEFQRRRTTPEELPEWCRDVEQVRKHARDGLAAGDPARTCEFYSICVEPLYHCGAAPGDTQTYPMNYGKKYCTKFAGEDWESGKGRLWRDRTLQCLQGSMVSWVQEIKGDCEALTNFAFDSHVPCYTQPGASICELMRPSPSDGGITARGQDILQIARTPDGSDLLTTRSARQIAGVIEECGKQVGSYAIDAAEDAAEGVGHAAVGVASAGVDAAQEAYDWASNLIGGDDDDD